MKMHAKSFLMLLLLSITLHVNGQSGSLPDQIEQNKPSIVGIGIYTPLESKAPQLLGTGFVVGNGSYVVTNYHVVSKDLRTDVVQSYVAMSGKGEQVSTFRIEVLAIDPVHDLAILSMKGQLPALTLAPDDLIREGSDIYFMGFPIGAVLGLFPATHTGILAAIAPDINPARNADELSINMLKRLKKPFMIYQLDATAYPGNSGSPVFDRQTGEVIGVINKVFVQAGKEAALSNPSGISYAIPIRQLRKLAQLNDIEL